MAQSADRTDPKLWDKVKADVTHGDKGGEPDQWSARKAQLAVAEYKKRGGGYKGKKSADNHLVQWTREEWGTESGKPSGETHERYLPRKAREKLTDAEYRRTTAKKRSDTAKGRQFSRQPEDVARKVAPTRATGAPTRSTGHKTRASHDHQAKAAHAGAERSGHAVRHAAGADAASKRNTGRTIAPERKTAEPAKQERARAVPARGAPAKRKAANSSPRQQGASPNKASLMTEARRRNIPGRSRMSRDQLEAALNA